MNTAGQLVKWLGTVGHRDLNLVGGKAIHLGELIEMGIRVPDGFCITTEAFEQHVEQLVSAGVIAPLDQILMGSESEVAKYLGLTRAAIESRPILEQTTSSVLDAYRQLERTGAERVAVRSSATAEDLPEASLAGQFVTKLNVCGDEALLNAIRECWSSLFREGILTYADAFAVDPRSIRMAVIVQTLVVAEKSGVMFTAHPVTGDTDKVLIEATYGLGVSTVGGLGHPDRFVIDKKSLGILSRQVSCKEKMIVPSPTGHGTSESTVLNRIKLKQSISDREVNALAQLGLRIESHFGSPQDIEWAIRDSEIFALQTRNITSL